MFPRVITTKRDGHTYRYLILVESYREAGKVKQRTIGNLGNVDRMSQDDILRLIAKLREFLHDKSQGSIYDLEAVGVKEYGIPYVVNFFWDQLGLSGAIHSLLAGKNVEFDVAACIKMMVVNRLVDPMSKLALTDWFDELWLPELEESAPPLHHLYRAMDYLFEIKNPLEKHVYEQMRDLFNLDLTVVFYDLTSTYFHGTHCPLAEYGYSRDHRSDLQQVTLGLLVTHEGLPIAHSVFSGKEADKSTVPSVLDRLKQDFQIGQCIFVGDRGMISGENLAALQTAGYPYIVGYYKRGRVLSDELLSQYTDLSCYVPMPGVEEEPVLLFQEIPYQLPESDDLAPTAIRFFLCHNPDKVEYDRQVREQILQETEERLTELIRSLERIGGRGRKADPKHTTMKVAAILEKRNAARYFDLWYDERQIPRFAKNQAAIDKETLRDGKFLIQSNSTLPAAEVIAAYKNLTRVENAFRELKGFIRMRPVFHYSENRVRAHIFICVLAYLFEQWLEVLHRRQAERLTEKANRTPEGPERDKLLAEARELRRSGRKILHLLAKVKAVDQAFLETRVYSTTRLKPEQVQTFKALGVPIPEQILLRKSPNLGL